MLFRCFVSAFNVKLGTSVPFEAMDAAKHAVIKEQRSGARIDVPYPVRLRGIDSDGRTFKEETVVENLSGGGLYLRLKRTVREGADVSLAVRLSTAPALDVPALRLAARGTVLRVEPQSDGGYGVAIEFNRRRVL